MNELSMAIVVMAAVTGLYALENLDKGKGACDLNLEVIYEMDFEEPVVDVIFDTATVTIEEAKRMGWKEEVFRDVGTSGKVTVFYPKVLFISADGTLSYDPLDNSKKMTEMRFLSKDGNLLKKVIVRSGAERVIYSENGRYILRTWITDEDYPERMGGTLYKSDGSVLWEKSENTPVEVSNEGYVIAVWPFCSPEEPAEGHIFYDPSGKEIARIINPLKDKPRGYTAAKFSSSGEYAVIGYTDFAKTVIFLVGKEGNVIWQKEFDWRSYASNDMDIIENIGLIGIYDEGGPNVFFIDWNGDLRWASPLEIRGNINVKSSRDNMKAYVISSNGYVWCIDRLRGNILWEHIEEWATNPQFAEKRMSWEIPRFVESKVIDDHLYVLGKKGRDWHGSTLFVIDGRNGTLIKKLEYPRDKITFVKTYDGIGLINFTKKKILLFAEEASRY